MNYKAISTRSLYALHQGIHHAVATDEVRPRHLWLYGVRVFQDWTIQSRTIEAELKARGLGFVPTGL